MYEVHLYKSIANDNYYDNEYIFKNKDQLAVYAVEVKQPYLNMNSLSTIWKSKDLQ